MIMLLLRINLNDIMGRENGMGGQEESTNQTDDKTNVGNDNRFDPILNGLDSDLINIAQYPFNLKHFEHCYD